MRKLLSAFLAASMMTSFAMTTVSAASTNAAFALDFGSVALESNSEDTSLGGTEKLGAGDATLEVYADDGSSVTFRSQRALNYGDSAATIANAFAGAEAELNYDGIIYTLRLSNSGSGKLTATVYPAGAIEFSLYGGTLGPLNDGSDNGELEFDNSASADYQLDSITRTGAGSGGTYDSSNQTIDIEQVVYTNSSGTAVPLVEDKDDLNGQGDGVRSGTDVYFLINEPFDDDKYFKLKVSKGENSKNIKSISVVSKYFTNELYNVFTENQMPSGTTSGRHSFIKVELNELYTDDEYKITYDLKVSLTSDGEDRYPDYEDTSIKAEDITTIWLKNKIEDGDGEYRVGEAGMMISPEENDWNEIVWYDEESDLARLYFFADSDVDAFYSKLSTKWEHADYASYFNDQDAYLFSFTGSPSLSSTSRADLEIYNPFVDEDGNETIDPETAVIYQVIDGDLYDVTDSFTYEEGDNGDMAYTTRTRFLGTYIICEKAVEEAADDADYSDVTDDGGAEELIPEDTASPEESAPEEGGKQPANTGRYDF